MAAIMLPELKTFFIAMSPLVELRGAIPVALQVYDLPVWSAFALSVSGNIFPVFFILHFLESVSDYLSRRSLFFNRFFIRLFSRTRRKNEKKFDKWGKLALVIFVAIPLPLTGAWTGALCAFLFGIRPKEAFPLIFAGVVIAGAAVTLLALGIFRFIG